MDRLREAVFVLVPAFVTVAMATSVLVVVLRGDEPPGPIVDLLKILAGYYFGVGVARLR